VHSSVSACARLHVSTDVWVDREQKATVDVRDKRGRTALHFAASQGHVKCTTMLLDHVSWV
jgi:ankyrin repeat protein